MVSVYNIGLRGDELEKKMGGGIPTGSVMLIEGEDGFGKSIFSQRITHGALQNNHSVTYISTELTVSSFMNQMESLRYEVKEPFVDQRLKFISTFPTMGEIDINKKNLIKKVFEEPKLFESDIIIFDTINDLLMDKDIDLKESYKLLSLLNKIASQGKTIVITADPKTMGEKLLRLLKNSANIYFSLEEKVQYGNRVTIMKAIRFNGAKADVDREIPFKVRAGVGIVIELSA